MSDALAFQSVPVFLFIYPQQPVVEDAISVVAEPASTGELVLQGISPDIYSETWVSFQVPEAAHIESFPFSPSVAITYPRRVETSRRLNRTAWQGRLGSKLDSVKRKVLDNSLMLTAHPTDMLRIRVVRDERTQDIKSRTIVSSEILPIVLPVIKDVPMRRMTRQDTLQSTIFSLDMVGDSQPKPIEAYCPLGGQLERDDLLFRIIKDPYADLPYVMVLQVKDEIGTLSYSSLLYVKYSLSFYDEQLPSEVLEALVDASNKREELGW